MEKTPGSSLREAICARVTVCDRGEKINHFQKPHCFKIWSNATVLSAKYSIWQKQVVEKHKGNLPDWPGQSLFFNYFLLVFFPLSVAQTAVREDQWPGRAQVGESPAGDG